MKFVPEYFRALVTRPGFVQNIRHAFTLGGYQISYGGGVDISDDGLGWVRMLNLTHKSGYTMRIVDPQDLHIIVGDYPSETQVRAYYGYPGAVA